jgi:flagellar biosynthesis protein FliP
VQGLTEQLFGGKDLATSLKILGVLTLLSLLPAIVLTTTSFVRTVVVLSFVRQGVGTPQTPPTQVVIGLAMFLTSFVMAPVFERMNDTAFKPYMAGEIGDIEALTRAAEPLKEFMLRQRRINAHGNAGVRYFRVNDRVSDGRHRAVAVSSRGSGGRFIADEHGHDDGATDHVEFAREVAVIRVG